jgi:hypothetical protein
MIGTAQSTCYLKNNLTASPGAVSSLSLLESHQAEYLTASPGTVPSLSLLESHQAEFSGSGSGSGFRQLHASDLDPKPLSPAEQAEFQLPSGENGMVHDDGAFHGSAFKDPGGWLHHVFSSIWGFVVGSSSTTMNGAVQSLQAAPAAGDSTASATDSTAGSYHLNQLLSRHGVLVILLALTSLLMGFLHLHFMNFGMSRFRQNLFFPVHVGCWVMFNALYGAIIFHEMPANVYVFSFGCLLVMGGIGMFASTEEGEKIDAAAKLAQDQYARELEAQELEATSTKESATPTTTQMVGTKVGYYSY